MHGPRRLMSVCEIMANLRLSCYSSVSYIHEMEFGRVDEAAVRKRWTRSPKPLPRPLTSILCVAGRLGSLWPIR